MDTKHIAEAATDILEEYEGKSTEWCCRIAADQLGVDRMDVFGALIAHPDISGFTPAESKADE